MSSAAFDLTPEALQRANLRAMTLEQLDGELAAVNKQRQSKRRDTYLGYLSDEYRRRGKKPPDQRAKPKE